MNRRELVARIGRAAVLVAVGAALAATSLPWCPEPSATARFSVASSCGPSGESDAWYAGDNDEHDCDVHDQMAFPGGPALGLPDGGLLDVPEGGWPYDYEGNVLREGRFVLLGDVVVPGSGARVHRTCRLTATTSPETFGLACEGPEPEAACAGTLTLLEAAP